MYNLRNYCVNGSDGTILPKYDITYYALSDVSRVVYMLRIVGTLYCTKKARLLYGLPT